MLLYLYNKILILKLAKLRGIEMKRILFPLKLVKLHRGNEN